MTSHKSYANAQPSSYQPLSSLTECIYCLDFKDQPTADIDLTISPLFHTTHQFMAIGTNLIIFSSAVNPTVTLPTFPIINLYRTPSIIRNQHTVNSQTKTSCIYYSYFVILDFYAISIFLRF